MVDNYQKMYSKVPAYILGFHGCNKDTFNEVIYNRKMLKKSNKAYDWLGSGIYFWENSYSRAVDWAKEHYEKDGTVIGAIIDLGYCLDLTDYRSTSILKNGYAILKDYCDNSGIDLPQNKFGHSKIDKLVRNLDCAVIQTIHDYNLENGLQSYDSVRGMFDEGNDMYPGAGFKEKTHTQVCVINPNCIKGFFIPREMDDNYPLP